MASTKCPDCGKKMEMYYTLQCFHCKKPKIKNKRGNLFMAMYWLRNNEAEFSKDDFWSHLCDLGIIERNDSWVSLDSLLEEVESEDEIDNISVKLFHKHFKLNKDTLWEVSW